MHLPNSGSWLPCGLASAPLLFAFWIQKWQKETGSKNQEPGSIYTSRILAPGSWFPCGLASVTAFRG